MDPPQDEFTLNGQAIGRFRLTGQTTLNIDFLEASQRHPTTSASDLSYLLAEGGRSVMQAFSRRRQTWWFM